MLIDGVWFENAVRFPVERRGRPSYEMMCYMAPDERMIPTLADAMNIEDFDQGLRDDSDREMAEYLADLVLPADRQARRQMLRGLEESALKPAISACIAAKRTADESYRACRLAIDAREADAKNASAFAGRANLRLNVSARAALEAHRLCEIARGKCRAITMAEMNEPWSPFDVREATQWLLDAGARAMERRPAAQG
jgi:hypothetical protein